MKPSSTTICIRRKEEDHKAPSPFLSLSLGSGLTRRAGSLLFMAPQLRCFMTGDSRTQHQILVPIHISFTTARRQLSTQFFFQTRSLPMFLERLSIDCACASPQLESKCFVCFLI